MSENCALDYSVMIICEVFGEIEVAVVEGYASLAQALLELPFDHCFFTGALWI